MEQSRRIRAIVITLLILAVIGAAVYFWFFIFSKSGNQPGATPSYGSLPTIGGRAGLGNGPGAGNGNGQPNPPGTTATFLNLPREIIAKDILAPAMASNGKQLLYILRESGHVVSSDLDGSNEKTLVNLTVLESFDGSWPKDRARVAMRYNDNGTVKSFLNGVATGTVSRFLPAEATAYDFSPDGTSIAYLVKRTNDTALIMADAGNKSPKIVYTTPVPDFTIRWISKSTMVLVSRPSGLAPSLILTFDLLTHKTASILNGTRGVIILPVPDGSGFIFSQSDQNGVAQAIARYTFKTGATDVLNLTTIADKCGFSANGKVLYCGAPAGGLPGTMPDDWYRGATSFSDAIVAVDLVTNQVITLAPSTSDFNVDATWLFTSPDGTMLFFQNKTTEHLWRIDLASATTTR